MTDREPSTACHQSPPHKMAPAGETRVRVERLVRADPTRPAAEIARSVGVSRERVRQILEDLGYRLEWRKS